MSVAEFQNWQRYRNRHGTLHIGMRIDRAVSLQLSTWLSVRGGNKVEPLAFSVYDKTPAEPQEEGTIEQAFSLLSSVSKRT